jgi:hypothetical protein
LIIPNSVYGEWCEFSTYLNFKVNLTKSFSGNEILFRESCGGHYFDFTDVTPILRKEQSGQSVLDWLWLLNSVRLKELYWDLKSVRKWYERWKTAVDSAYPLSRNTCVPPSYGLVTGWVEPNPTLVPKVKYLRTSYYVTTALTLTQQMHEHNGNLALHAHLFGGKFEASEPRPWETNTLLQTTGQSSNVLIADLPLTRLFKEAIHNAAVYNRKCAPIVSDEYIHHFGEMVKRNESQGYRRAVKDGKVIQQCWNQGWWS